MHFFEKNFPLSLMELGCSIFLGVLFGALLEILLNRENFVIRRNERECSPIIISSIPRRRECRSSSIYNVPAYSSNILAFEEKHKRIENRNEKNLRFGRSLNFSICWNTNPSFFERESFESKTNQVKFTSNSRRRILDVINSAHFCMDMYLISSLETQNIKRAESKERDTEALSHESLSDEPYVGGPEDDELYSILISKFSRLRISEGNNEKSDNTDI